MNIVDLLQKAVKAHQLKDYQTAEKLYISAIRNYSNPEAMQLLGSLYSSIGRFQDAETLFKNSLKINPKQPHTLYNLALCSKKQKKIQQSVRYLLDAIRQDGSNEQYFYSAIDSCISISDLEAAKQLTAQALQKFPSSYRIYFLRALIADSENNVQETELYLQKSLLFNESYLPTINKLAVFYRKNHNPEKGIALLEKVRDSSAFEIFHNLGNCYSDLGESINAAKSYRKAININPCYPPSHQNLNDILWKLNDHQNFLDSYNKVDFNNPETNELFYDYCRFLLNAKKIDLCKSKLVDSKSHFNRSPYFKELTARILDSEGRHEEAEIFWRDALNYNNDLITNFLTNLIIQNKVMEAKTVLAKIDNDSVIYLAYKNLIDRLDDNNSLVIDDLICEYSLLDNNSFSNEQLKNYLKELHLNCENEPIDQTLINGKQTSGNLFAYNNIHVHAFFRAIEPKINRYLDKYQHSIPILKNKGTNVKVTSAWSIQLKKDGFHSMHIHPLGHLSCVYYCEVPPEINHESNQGWLKFGKPNFEHANLTNTKFIKPEIGKLVIFPSYYWHGTEPFSSNSYRTTIAFDITTS